MTPQEKSKERVLDHLYWLAHSDDIRSNEIAYQIILDAICRVNQGREVINV